MSFGNSVTGKIQEWILNSKAFDRPLITLIKFPIIGPWARAKLATREILSSPDRTVFRGPLLAALREDGLLRTGSQILWIGCASYTSGQYKLLESGGAQCFTIELDPAERQWGREGRHTVGNMLDLDRHYSPAAFDLILCNGVLGWGVNAIEDQRRAFDVMAQALKPGGALVVGWNTDKITDPVQAGLHAPQFIPEAIGSFPSRYAVENVSHIYDCFRRAG